jgi:hypothetical protein
VIGTIATMVGYAKAPKTTFVLKHPVKSFQIMRTRRRFKNAIRSPRTLVTLGAAVAAVPLGFWVGSRIRNR